MEFALKPPEPIRVKVFVDEIQGIKSNALGEKWLYIGLLIIPESHYEHVYQELQRARQLAEAYNREIHYVQLKNYSYANGHNQKTLVAKRWVQNVIDDDRKRYHFHLVGINLSYLNPRAFGPKHEQKRNIYRRFFRSSLDYALKSFFQGAPVHVTGVYHDVSELENDSWFSWHPIRKLHQQNRSATFADKSIKFVVSDHQKEPHHPEASHFIQLCDVLLGSFVKIIEGRNKKDGCNEIADMVSPLVERITDSKRKRNPNSRYRLHRRISASFFPSQKLSDEELHDKAKRTQSQFYCDRQLLGKKHEGELQMSLFDAF